MLFFSVFYAGFFVGFILVYFGGKGRAGVWPVGFFCAFQCHSILTVFCFCCR